MSECLATPGLEQLPGIKEEAGKQRVILGASSWQVCLKRTQPLSNPNNRGVRFIPREEAYSTDPFSPILIGVEFAGWRSKEVKRSYFAPEEYVQSVRDLVKFSYLS